MQGISVVRAVVVAVALMAPMLKGASASAQCNGGCAQATEHWSIFFNYNSPVAIGMSWNSSTSTYHPVFCYYDQAGFWVYGQPIGPGRSSTALQTTTSICGTQLDDSISLVPEGTSILCKGLPGPSVIEVFGFDHNGYDFWISGGDGNDTLRAEDSAVLCGGNGNDILVGGSGNHYIAGENGHDYIDGGGGYDNVRGNLDNDVIVHARTPDADKVRADAGNDCLVFGAGVSYHSESTCSSGADRWFSLSANFTPPPACEAQVSTLNECCTGSGRHCELNVTAW